jgi:hypothetical protein
MLQEQLDADDIAVFDDIEVLDYTMVVVPYDLLVQITQNHYYWHLLKLMIFNYLWI